MPPTVARRLLLVLVLLPAGAAGAEPVMGLIVTNNRSVHLQRPDLRYADDDGARYYEMLRMVAPAENLRLLTELDADTARLFPSLVPVTRPPTLENLRREVEALAAAARQVPAVDFYFIFAGHGDVDRGRGFLELRDGVLTADALEELLAKFPAARVHVILDSCNSFFAITPRKPGGRRFGTPADAAESLSRRLPNVGVFLSTSSAGEVFEWSELQSGIFSHAVRSGLSGAADADNDGRVSYEELEAFVDTAAREVKNPLYRPSVFARGPQGRGDVPLLSLLYARGRSLAIDGRQRRLTVRDREEVPWIDMHKETDARVTVHLPERVGAHFTVEEREQRGDESVVVERRAARGDLPEAVLLSALIPAEPAGGARGPQELFRMLFTSPFGPQALHAWRAVIASRPPPVYGISPDDVSRMRLLLRETAGLDRQYLVGSYVGLAVGGLVITGVGLVGALRTEPFAAMAFETRASQLENLSYWTLAGLGSAAVGAGILVPILVRSKGEKLMLRFEDSLRGGRDPLQTLADVEQRLDELGAGERSRRTTIKIAAPLFLTAFVAGSALLIAADHPEYVILVADVAGACGYLFTSAFFETPIERMVRLWRDDPSLRHLRPSSIALVPSLGVSAGGFTLSLSSRF